MNDEKSNDDGPKDEGLNSLSMNRACQNNFQACWIPLSLPFWIPLTKLKYLSSYSQCIEL